MTIAMRQLYEIVQGSPLAKKIWVVDSYAAGRQTVQRIARELGPVTNLEIATVEGLARSRALPALAAAGLTYASRGETYWIVFSLMRSATAPWSGYVPPALVTSGVADRFHRALTELREAGVSSEDVAVEAFEQRAKGEYIRGLYSAYEEALARHRIVDFAELTRLAAPARTDAASVFLLDGGVRLSEVACAMLERLAGDRGALRLSPEPDFLAPESYFPIDAVDWFRALGPLSESKEALRRAAASGVPWDDCELLLSDYAGYAPILYGLCRRFDIPATFAGGLPIGFSPLGKAALGYLDWLASGYRADALASAMKLGGVRPPEDAEFQRSDAIRLLESSGIGWGRERYVLLTSHPYERDSDRSAADWLDRLIRGWLLPVPTKASDWSAAAVADGLAAFLADCRPPAAAADASVVAAVAELREQLQRWAADPIGAADALSVVRRRLEGCAVEAESSPQPGKLHVASLEQGGLSGRRLSIALGMSEEHWSASVRQDPVLLDDERVRLSDALETSGGRALREREARGRRLGSVRGRVVFGYSSLRLAQDAESSPAYELLQLYRAARGEPEADFETLDAAIGEPAGWIGAGGFAADLEDGVTRALQSPDRMLRDGAAEVFRLFPSLANGAAAVAARMKPVVGPYDGLVPSLAHGAAIGDGTEAASPIRLISASKLETYAKCPLMFFYQDVLGVRPKEIVEYDRTRWLDAMQRGQLLHDIFCDYMSETAKQGGHDRGRLEAICERKLLEAAAQVPPPSPHIYAKECDAVRKDVAVFWRMESRRESKPRWFELELHKDEEAFALELADGFRLSLRGYVDRIDEVGEHRYKIIDYKTGQPKYYDEGAFFAGGTQIQHALYALAVEQWLRRTGADPEARVTEAAYAFPTERGLGEEVSRPQEGRRDDTVALLRRTLEAIRGGLFPPTDKPELCRRCDYAAVCGSHAEWKKHARAFPENRDRLAPLLEVNGSV
ncbi:PD-(D/E)XK nuclease family protein [Paenibacillus sp.]|uniref:PD-(D/E)XK nuclease family protein n=1 Tax=Paenibacillus sp. TaxID=58172 RepID=UPI002811D523|nr:PD-(D/E)XK nuclease family protein [Paenibacillus sp.]